uniref:Histone H4 transcription factor n=1 Tax=Cacopsylla melanoneura TaxID=428564 RepID=A0A8D9E291_9HEMI
MAEEDDVFTLPEYEESDSDNDDQDEVIEVKGDSEDEPCNRNITDTHDIVAGLNSTIVSEVNSNYCESVTSCSTGILTDTEHKLANRRIIHIDESSEESSEENDEDVFFEKENTSRKRKRENTEDEEDDSQCVSESTDIIIVSKGSGKVQKRPAPVLFSNEELKLKCEWIVGEEECNFPETSNKYDFANHVKKHTEHLKFLENGKYQCQWKGCGVVLEAHQCVFHVYYHTYHTSLKCIGENCAKRHSLKKCSYNPSKVNVIGSKETNRVCMWNNCRQSFVNMFAYEIHIAHHMDKFHEKADQNVRLPCEWKNCSPRLSANRKAMMLRHVLKHTQLKQLACPTCGDMFQTRISFKTHCYRLKKDVDLQCNLCKKFFSNESLLHNHVQNHVYTKQCHICQAMCLSASSLATHIRYKHLDGQHHLFKCNECDFKTISNYQLVAHKRTHLPTEQRPKLYCDYAGCDYSCLCKRTLYDHVKSKHEGAKYACHLCSKEYSASTILSKHLKKKHNLTFPVGTDRFRFRKDKEGNYRLQTVRYESIENEDEIHPHYNRNRASSSSDSKIPRYNLRVLTNQNENKKDVQVVLELDKRTAVDEKESESVLGD